MFAYRITCTVNQKAYIGITTKTVETRWDKHRWNAAGDPKKCQALYAAIRKYGVESFTIETIACARNLADLLVLEVLLIKQESTLAPNGYNLTLGGEGRFAPHSAAACASISAALTEAWRTGRRKGHKFSTEVKLVMSEKKKSRAKQAAIANGETFYHSTKPCPYGHTLRYTKHSRCVECNKRQIRERIERNKSVSDHTSLGQVVHSGR